MTNKNQISDLAEIKFISYSEGTKSFIKEKKIVISAIVLSIYVPTLLLALLVMGESMILGLVLSTFILLLPLILFLARKSVGKSFEQYCLRERFSKQSKMYTYRT